MRSSMIRCFLLVTTIGALVASGCSDDKASDPDASLDATSPAPDSSADLAEPDSTAPDAAPPDATPPDSNPASDAPQTWVGKPCHDVVAEYSVICIVNPPVVKHIASGGNHLAAILFVGDDMGLVIGVEDGHVGA